MSESSTNMVPLRISTVVRKLDAETDPVSAIQSKALVLEDEFEALYFTGEGSDGIIIRPPWDFRRLRRMVIENNTLKQAVSAMEVNVAGTGWEVERADGGRVEENNAEKIQIESFLGEVFPGVSWDVVKKKLRVDLEETGNAYLEALRNPQRDIVFLNRIDPVTMRLVRLDDPIEEVKEVMRNGAKVSLKIGVRERRFAQKVGTNTLYFKEFGATRDINRRTGEWSPKGSELPANDRGTEIMHFTLNEDADTPYGLPRWVNQTPSVLGSRKAEELNLEYFDSGGIPPLLLMISGGALVPEARAHMEELLGGNAKDKLRAVIAEVEPTGGGLDSTGSVKIDVERFGSDQQTDSLFEAYNDKCAGRIRSAFRLPPLFFGAAETYNFSTAFASYLVAEAQVFAPERDEDDELLNSKILRAMGIEEHRVRSKQLSVTNIVDQLKALEIAAVNGWLAGEDGIHTLNEISGLNMKYSPMELDAEELVDDEEAFVADGAGASLDPDGVPAERRPESPVAKSQRRRVWKKREPVTDLISMAKEFVTLNKQLAEGDDGEEIQKRKAALNTRVGALQWSQKQVLQALVMAHLLPEDYVDDPELQELCSRAQEAMLR